MCTLFPCEASPAVAVTKYSDVRQVVVLEQRLEKNQGRLHNHFSCPLSGIFLADMAGHPCFVRRVTFSWPQLVPSTVAAENNIIYETVTTPICDEWQHVIDDPS